MTPNQEKLAVSDEAMMSRIHEFRGQKVMLDSDLAELYGVETKVLKQAVRRNLDIFPDSFMFELSKKEFESLRSQTVTSKHRRGGTRYLPMVFTEHGTLQLANVLRSESARHMSIRIIQVFVRMREMLTAHKELFVQLEALRQKVSGHDEQIELIFDYLGKLEQNRRQESEQQNRKRIGYKLKGEE